MIISTKEFPAVTLHCSRCGENVELAVFGELDEQTPPMVRALVNGIVASGVIKDREIELPGAYTCEDCER